MSGQQLYAKYGEPSTERVIRCDGAALDPGVPSEVVVPIWLGLGSDEITLADSSILITDFGEAFDPQTIKRFTAHTPLLLSPPESRFLTQKASLFLFLEIFGRLHVLSGRSLGLIPPLNPFLPRWMM